MTRIQRIRSLAALRPDLSTYRDLEAACRIGLKSLAQRYLELHDEIVDLDVMISGIVEELVPDLISRNSIGHNSAAQLLLTAGDNPERLKSEGSIAALCGVSPLPASSGTGSIVVEAEPQTGRCTSLQSDGSEPMRRPGPKVRVAWQKDIPNRRLYGS